MLSVYDGIPKDEPCAIFPIIEIGGEVFLIFHLFYSRLKLPRAIQDWKLSLFLINGIFTRNIYVVKAKLATCGQWIRSKTENSRITLRNTCPSIHQWYPKTLNLIMDSREITSSTKRLFFSSRGTQTMDANGSE